MRAMYTPNVTGRNHYAIRKKDYNPTEAEAKAFFNITEVVGTFLTVGRRVTGNTFTRMASHRIVAPTRQQSQRQAMVRKYRAVATHHKAKVPPLEQLIAYRRPDKKLASYFSITGQLSYFCHMVLGRLGLGTCQPFFSIYPARISRFFDQSEGLSSTGLHLNSAGVHGACRSE